MEKFIKGEFGDVERMLLEPTVESSKALGMLILAMSMRAHELTIIGLDGAKMADGQEISQKDLQDMRELSSEQQLVAGMMLVLSLLLQMVERVGPELQMTALAIVAEELQRWENKDELHVSDVLQGLMITKDKGTKLN